MSYTNYHINQGFSDTFLKYSFIILGYIATVVRPLKITWWKTGVINSLNKRLTNIYIKSEGLKVVVKGFDQEKAFEEHPASKELLSAFRSLYARLEKNNFFNNPQTQELSENILSNFYAVESHIRRLAFSNGIQVPEDSNLTNFASHLSLSSLQD